VTPPPDGVVLQHARVVQHDRIAADPLAFVAGRVAATAARALHIDLRDHLIFPGLINAHDHLQLNSVPPLEHEQPFPNSYAWVEAFEAHRNDPQIIAAVSVPSAARHWQGGLKNLLAGVTTVAHHDPWHAALDDPGFPVAVLREFGWSHSLRLGAPRGDRPPRYGPPVRSSFVGTSPAHPWVIHLAEGTDALSHAELGELDTLGCLAANTVLVHGVGMTASDIDRVLERGAAVVWCPASNDGMFGCTLHARDIRRLLDAGRLALGNDSRLTGSRDLLDELRSAAARADLSSRELLRAVTTCAADILRIPDRGELAIGQYADCLILRAGADPYDVLIGTRRSDIRAVVRGGAPLVADPDLADWFSHCGIPAVSASLDGRPKLLARHLARPEATALEPGLEITGAIGARTELLNARLEE
jgi:cytosine/adenosine deaminase-related metal-dependent hydrolase